MFLLNFFKHIENNNFKLKEKETTPHYTIDVFSNYLMNPLKQIKRCSRENINIDYDDKEDYKAQLKDQNQILDAWYYKNAKNSEYIQQKKRYIQYYLKDNI